MNKLDIKKLNTIKKCLMDDIKTVAKDRTYRLGYKQGFNVARRRIRKVLEVLVTDKQP